MTPANIDPLTLPSIPLSDRHLLPDAAGVYLAVDDSGTVQYIDKSKNLRQRWINGHHRWKELLAVAGVRLVWLQVSDPVFIPAIEEALIAQLQPALNKTSAGGFERRFPAVEGQPTRVVLRVNHLFPKNLSNRQIGEKLELTDQSVANLRRGTERGEWATLIKLARWLSDVHGRVFAIEDLLSIEGCLPSS